MAYLAAMKTPEAKEDAEDTRLQIECDHVWTPPGRGKISKLRQRLRPERTNAPNIVLPQPGQKDL